METRKQLVCALVLTRVDYCNSVLAGLPDFTLAPLQRQRVLHAAARFVLDLRPQDHVTAALQLLHWLPVRQRITYKLCVLMHGVADISTGHCRATLDTAGRRRTIRRATGVQERSKSVLRRRSTSLELTPYISSSMRRIF